MKVYSEERLKRREIILSVYRGREFNEGEPSAQGLPTLQHHLIRRYFIRPALRAAGVSLSPLKFTSIRYPRTFEEGIKLWRLQHRSVPRKADSIETEIERQKREQEEAYRDQYRRSRRPQLMFRQFPDPSFPTGPKLTLKALAAVYNRDGRLYPQVKELFLDGADGTDAIMQALRELGLPTEVIEK